MKKIIISIIIVFITIYLCSIPKSKSSDIEIMTTTTQTTTLSTSTTKIFKTTKKPIKTTTKKKVANTTSKTTVKDNTTIKVKETTTTTKKESVCSKAFYIPKINLCSDYVTQDNVHDNLPTYYPNTPKPCEHRRPQPTDPNYYSRYGSTGTFFGGHTYGIFTRITELSAGDKIIIDGCTYKVTYSELLNRDDEDFGDKYFMAKGSSDLVMITCYKANERTPYILHANLQ